MTTSKTEHIDRFAQERGFAMKTYFINCIRRGDRDELERQLVELGMDELMQEVFGDDVDVMVYTLSTEKGYVLMSDIHGCNPFEVGMEKGIDFSKKSFVGKRALLKMRDKPCARKLVSIVIDDPEALVYGGPKGARILKEGRDVGRVTKTTYGATIGSNIGLALINVDKAQIGYKVTVNGYAATLGGASAALGPLPAFAPHLQQNGRGRRTPAVLCSVDVTEPTAPPHDISRR